MMLKYVTKWAIASGITVEDVEDRDGYFICQKPYVEVISKEHVHDTLDDAISHASAMRDKKVASLRKQISKLEARDFRAEAAKKEIR